MLEVIKAAKDNNCSIRIGVNAGSLDKTLLEKYKEPCPEALVESAMYNIKLLEDNDFFNFKISVKSSDIFLTVKAYRKLSKLCDYPLTFRCNRGWRIVYWQHKIFNWYWTTFNGRYWRYD